MFSRFQELLLALSILSPSLNVQGVLASNVLDVFPELKGKGPAEVAYINPSTHKVSMEKVEANGNVKVGVSKRGANADEAVVRLLKKYDGYGVCKGLCPGYNPPAVTVTQLKSTTKTVQTTTTVCAGGSCNPLTVTLTATALAPKDLTTTQTNSVSITTTNTASADPVTTTIVESSTITTVQPIVVTSTFTVPFPTTTLVPRNFDVPAWLKGIASPIVCHACTKVWPTPSTKTVSACRTTTVTKTQTRTVTKARATTTASTTVTPSAKVVTVVVSTTLSFTDTTTVTPVVTAKSTTVFTTTATVASTTTTSVCAQQTNGVVGIQASPSGQLVNDKANTVADCCIACYNTPGCNQWAYFSVCFISRNNAPGTSPQTAACPNGKGLGSLFLESSYPQYAGGRGQCSSD